MLLICSCQNNRGGLSLGKINYPIHDKGKGLTEKKILEKKIGDSKLGFNQKVCFAWNLLKNFEEKGGRKKKKSHQLTHPFLPFSQTSPFPVIPRLFIIKKIILKII